MVFSEETSLPPLQELTNVLPEKVAASKAFYAASVDEEDSEDPVSNYQTIKSELETQGTSALLESAENKWKTEQDEIAKSYFTKLISDPNVDNKTKKEALSLYSVSGYLSKSLKDKYAEKVATQSIGFRLEDEKALDELLKTFPQRKRASDQEAIQENIDNAELGIKAYAKGSAYIAANVISSIPASIWGGLQGLWDKGDLIGAKEGAAEIAQAWSISPTDPSTQEAVNRLGKKLEVFEIPYNFGVSETLKNTGNENAAIVGGMITEGAVGAIVGAPILSAVRRIKKGTPKLKKNTPLDTTITANSEKAGELAILAVKDSTGQLSTAIGEDAGTIISNLAFPKPYKTDSTTNLPSISQDLIKEISDLDKKIIEDMEAFRWDPNLTDADLRKSDYELIVTTSKEVNTPSYMEANSTLFPTNTNLYEGKAVFGRSKYLFYHSRNEVIRAYDEISAKFKDLPEELNITVSIVDRLTGNKYTPDELLVDPKFKSGLDKLNEIPDVTTTGIPVKKGPTGKSRKDGSPVSAFLKRDPDGKPLEIVIDVDTIKSQFDSKPWTKPKVEGVRPLPDKLFKTPEQWAKFIYLHEEAHITTPNSGLSKADYENLINDKAVEAFKAEVDQSWNSPAMSSKQFSVEVEWAREYDDLSLNAFNGVDAINATLERGIDVSALARSSASQWIFGGTGIFSSWFEIAGARASIRAARQAFPILNAIKKRIATTPYRKELNSLIELAEAKGIEAYTISEVTNMFPKLKVDQVQDLLDTHTMWRRVVHYNHALINMTYRNDLTNRGFTKGLYINNDYKGAINDKLATSTIRQDINKIPSVWDFDAELKIEFQLDRTKELATDIGGKRLVQLNKPFTDPDGNIYQYALVGGTKTKIDYLPDQVVPRIPGYTPIKTTASWYIDAIPTEAVINGITITDPNTLRNYKKTIAAGTNEKDARKLELEFQNKDEYKGYIVQARVDKDVSLNRIMVDNEAHQEILRNAMQRGERLPTLNGPAPIEDRLTSLIKSVQTLTRQNNMQAYEQATEAAWLRDFSKFITNKDEFPTLKSQIEPLTDMTPEEFAEFETAQRIWDQYAKIKSYGSWGDGAWANALNNVADVMEKIPVVYKKAYLARDLAKKGNILVNYPRQLASTLFISLNPSRQWLVQPAQLVELWAINPQTALQRLAEVSAFRMALASKVGILQSSNIDWGKAAKTLAPFMDEAEFNATVKALEDSGIMQTTDLNVLVSGIFENLDRPLLETPLQRATSTATAIPSGVVKLSKELGFTFAETTNQIGTWLIMRDKWKQNNPNGDWTSKKAVEEISHATWKWTGSMTKAGSYPYQTGSLSLLMQFGAITQKLSMNMLQKNGLLSPNEKARLIAARAVLWGGKYGIIGGPAIYYAIDQLDQDENPDVKKAGNYLKRGLADRTLSMLFDSLNGVEGSDLLVSKGMSPYGDSGTGIPYVEVITEFAKLFDGKEGTNPRLPSLGAGSATLDAIGKMRSWFITKDVTDENAYKQSMMEAFKVASGMNNIVKAQLMLSIKEKNTKRGNKLGLDFMASEAYAQMFGLGTWKEEELWKGLSASTDRKERIDNMSENIHEWMVNQETVLGINDPIKRFDMLVSFTTMLRDDKNWVDQDIEDLYVSVLEKMKRTSKNTTTSLIESYIKSHQDKDAKELNIVRGSLEEIAVSKPELKRLLDVSDGKGNP
jgi:hypothetical protein